LFKELSKINKSDKEKRTKIAKSYYKEQEQRQLANKVKDRICAVDLNPEYIGFNITDKNKVLFKQVINLTKLNTKLKLSSSDLKQIKQNNKRKHEIREVWKYIFDICKHYKVAKFAMEELNFKEVVNTSAKEANYKTKNVWHRTLTTDLITKYCNTLGIQLVEVNPAYSSFIGNIKHNYYDPLNASLEIARRGRTKYLKGDFYPKLERSDLNTMCLLGLDVSDKSISSWIEAYSYFKHAKLRYRKELNCSLEYNLSSHKSCVSLYNFK
jgi:IS605 OrfB family transposase